MVNFTTSSIVSDVSYGLGLLSSSGAKVDVVGIYSGAPSTTSSGSGASGGLSTLVNALGNNSVVNSLLGKNSTTPGFGQLFGNARPMKATVRETSKVMEHPVETGSMLSDFHIINPVEIDLPLIVTNGNGGGLLTSLFGATTAQNYAATYAQIRNAFINATPLTVKTRTGSYQNMIIADMPHEEDPEMYNAIIITLHLKQVLLFTSGQTTLQAGYQPASAANNNTILSGLQQGIALATKIGTTALSVASYISVGKKKLL